MKWHWTSLCDQNIIFLYKSEETLLTWESDDMNTTLRERNCNSCCGSLPSGARVEDPGPTKSSPAGEGQCWILTYLFLERKQGVGE